MKEGTSSLDPKAASYVPVSRFKELSLTHGNQDLPVDHQPEKTLLPGHPLNSKSHEHSSTANPTADNHGGVVASTSQGACNNIKISGPDEEDNEMDLAFLALHYPDISDAFLHAVYVANQYDLEDSMSMLDLLQDKDETFPDRIPEFGFAADQDSTAFPRVQNVAATSGVSQYPSSKSTPPT